MQSAKERNASHLKFGIKGSAVQRQHLYPTDFLNTNNAKSFFNEIPFQTDEVGFHRLIASSAAGGLRPSNSPNLLKKVVISLE